MKEEKQMAQILSAQRSLVTNLICMSVFSVGLTLVFLLPVHARTYFSVTVFSFVKGLMPLLTALANFGTVQSVLRQYKEHFCQLHVMTIICKE
jgi:high-affinity K+ transport system ATPase subunit B